MASSQPSTRPRIVDDVESWDLEADVVIVGYGGAGACAAIEAGRAGASVLILEAASGGGGSTAMSGGHIYMGGGTRVQKAVGLEDTPEEMYKYLMAGDDQPDEAKVRVFADESVAHFDWLVALGVPFTDKIWEERHVLQPDDSCLIWSGNEKAYPFNEIARPSARGHKVARDGEAGAELWIHLSAAVEAEGVQVEYDAKGRQLIQDRAGRIVGVVARKDGRDLNVCARRGVVLTSGGFIMNPDMIQNHIPLLYERFEHVTQHGNPHDDGSGIRMGAAAGASAVRMSDIFITTPWYPPASLTYGIMINNRGERFINEDCYHGRVAGAAFAQPDGEIYLISDNDSFGYPDFEMELVATEESIEDLERALGLPPTSLQHTVTFYNDHSAKGEDPLFHKHPNWLKPISEPPFAALNCSVGKSFYTVFTLGGLRTAPTGHALTEEGDVVPGLFAAGSNASGITRSASTYCSGQSVGDATFSGRKAGQSAAAAEPWQG